MAKIIIPTPLTGSEIKTLYEAEPDTNAYTDAAAGNVASNTAVRLTTDQYQAVTGADTPSASNVFLTEGDVGVAELSALMTDGPIAAFRIFADDTALQAAQGVANQYGWRQSDKTLWRDSGSTWEQVGASGTETNDLETACANIALNEVPVGSGAGVATYTATTGTGSVVRAGSPTLTTPFAR